MTYADRFELFDEPIDGTFWIFDHVSGTEYGYPNTYDRLVALKSLWADFGRFYQLNGGADSLVDKVNDNLKDHYEDRKDPKEKFYDDDY